MASGLAHASPKERGAGPLPLSGVGVGVGRRSRPAATAHPQAASQAPHAPDKGPVPRDTPRGHRGHAASRGGAPHKFAFQCVLPDQRRPLLTVPVAPTTDQCDRSATVDEQCSESRWRRRSSSAVLRETGGLAGGGAVGASAHVTHTHTA